MISEQVLPQMAAWFLTSGIVEPQGGVARYHFADRHENAPISTEITGYTVSSLLDLRRETGQAGLREKALECGEFLCGVWNSRLDAMPFELLADGEGFSYFFDNGIIARALLALWRETERPEFLEVATAVGDSMWRDFAANEGFHPIITLPGKHPLTHEKRWSREPGCFQLKAALAWHELAVITGEQRFLDAWRRQLDFSLQTHDSFLPGDPDELRVMDRLHAYSYFLEGLLPVADRPDCREAVTNGIERIGQLLRRIRPRFERSDVCAQLLRARLFAHHLGVASLDEEAAGEEAMWLLRYAGDQTSPASEQPPMSQGFWFGSKDGTTLPFVNPVSTAFCAQAWRLWMRHHQGHAVTEWLELV